MGPPTEAAKQRRLVPWPASNSERKILIMISFVSAVFSHTNTNTIKLRANIAESRDDRDGEVGASSRSFATKRHDLLRQSKIFCDFVRLMVAPQAAHVCLCR
jgi:hypothetical protein